MNPITLLVLLFAGCSCPEPPPSARSSSFLDPETLKALPQVHSVEVWSIGDQPNRQIIHILNWRYVDRESFAADGGEDWESFLADVEALQVEQIALLRELVKSYELKSVFLEGIAQDEMPAFKELLGMLAEWKKPEADTPLNEWLIGIHREDTLMVGAGGRLMMTGELDVLPAEDTQVLEAANPVKDMQVQWDDAANERREDAIVRNVLASELPVSVLILGGGHHLGSNLVRIGDGQLEYVRVQVEGHRKAAKVERRKAKTVRNVGRAPNKTRFF